MRKILITLICTLFAGITAWAQAPSLMNYQGVARSAAGAPLASTNISLRLTIHDGSASGTTDYAETHAVTTNAFGLYNVSVGSGTVTSGSFAGINWSSGTKWMQVEIDPAGGSSYTSVGTSQLLSVPYAMYAASSGGGGGGGITSSGTANYIPKFTSASNVGNSAMYQVGNKIGLGTTTPATTLHVASSTDSMAGYFTTTSSSPAVTHGIVEVDYGGTNDNVIAFVGDAYNVASNHATIGVEGVGTEVGTFGVGISTYTSAGTGIVRGTEGDSYGDDNSEGIAGIAGANVGTPSFAIGVLGNASGGITNYSGYFVGDVYVGGVLYAPSKSFKIDDPIDPANKYLVHTCVESNEMTTVYSGNATTDAGGVAVVTLPAYFQALNKDFRYQLTVIGAFAQAIVSKEVAANQFEIKTSVPNVKVSWQVTGVRNDTWANAHPVTAEVDKESFNKGKYLSAKEFGQPESKQIGAVLGKPGTKSATAKMATTVK